ncbi:MAG: PEGA domain-containing protein [Phycisphaerales bacterium]|nr:PEGA domain-containing protein [Phycisphaerales bacterium]
MKHAAAALLLLCPLTLVTGCVKRTISITSQPPGALVWLNDVQVGRTPCSTDFTFFGTYDVRLDLEGYEPVATSREAEPPIYEYPGFDLVAEAVPLNIATFIDWHFDLEPVAEATLDRREAEARLLERARQMQAEEAAKGSNETPSTDGNKKGK